MDSQKAALVAAGAAAGAAATYYYAGGTSEAAKPPPPPPATDNVICDEDVQRIVCYGDSNTWGLDAFTPGDAMRRFKHPWPRVLARKLGPGYDVVSEGLNGRTTIVDDPFMSDYDVNGRRTLPPILHSHKPIDVLVIMLGTNDLKKHLNLSPQLIARGAATLANDALRMDVWRSTPRVLLVCPVNIRQPPPSCRFAYSFDGGAAKAPPCETLPGRSRRARVASSTPTRRRRSRPEAGGMDPSLGPELRGPRWPVAESGDATGTFDETAPDERPVAEYSSLPVAGGKSPRISQK